MFRKKKSTEAESDFELNLTSIIDCFTVLITYLLVSASFISIGVMDVGVASQGNQSSQSLPPLENSVTVAIKLEASHQLTIKVRGSETQNLNIPAKNKTWDYEKLGQTLSELRGRWPKLDGALVAADNNVEYKEIVAAVELTRSKVGGVSLGEIESL